MVKINVRCERCGFEWEAEDYGGTITCPNCKLETTPVIFLEEEDEG